MTGCLLYSGRFLIESICNGFPFKVELAMTFPVIVQPTNGQFEATLVGAPDVRATAATREDALAALETALAKRLDQGELVALEVRRRGLAGLFGKYRDDPTLREICEAAYKERDADVRE
jgi:predicted RNase H-like HicB family nuclease